MEEINGLRKPPKYIGDVGLLANALYTLEKIEEREGIPYIFEAIQQPQIGGTCRLIPKSAVSYKDRGSILLGIYDKQDFRKRIKELRTK